MAGGCFGTFNFLAAQLLAAREAYPTKSYPSLGLLPTLRREAAGPGDAGGRARGYRDRQSRARPARVQAWEAVGVDRINFLLNALETVPQEEVLNSLRLFAK